MKLSRIVAQNFLSVQTRVRLNTRKRGLVYVEGENLDDPSATNNGSGKTTIFIDAPSWCLFGVTSRGLSGDEVVNRVIGKGCCVQCTFTNDVVVTRYRKDDTYKDKLTLFIDGKDRSKGTNKDTQLEIEKLLGMNEQTFLNSVMFGATPGYRFSSLTDKQQKEVFDDALGITQYAQACVNAREKLHVIEDNIQGHIVDRDKAQAEYHDLGDRIANLKKKSKRFNEEHETKINELKAKYNKINKEMTEKSISESLDYKLDQAKKRLKDAEDVAKRTQTSLMNLDVKKSLTIKTTVQLQKAYDDLASISKSYECEECGQEVTPESREDHRDSVKEKLKVAKVKEASAALTYQEARQEQDAYDDDVRRAQKKLAAVRKEMQEQEAASDAVRLLKRHINDLDKEISEQEKAENPYTSLLSRAKKEQAAAEQRQSDESDVIRELEKDRNDLEFWIDAFGTKGIRSLLIDTALPYLNNRVAHYATTLTDGSMDIEFCTQSKQKSGKAVDKFEVAVTNKFGAENYKGNSGGEKAKIDLCVGLALQDLVMSRSKTKMNVAFFDEAFEKLDSSGIDRAVQVLTEVAQNRESVFVVTHMEDLKAYFPSAIRVIKKKGATRLDE